MEINKFQCMLHIVCLLQKMEGIECVQIKTKITNQTYTISAYLVKNHHYDERFEVSSDMDDDEIVDKMEYIINRFHHFKNK